MHSAQSRSIAVSLRQQGLSLNQIYQHLHLPKITVYGWIRHIPKPKLTPQGYRIALPLIQISQSRGIKGKRLKELSAITLQTHQDVSTYTPLFKREYYRSLLAMLYWAEGTKTHDNKRPSLIFANTDPSLCQLYINLLRASYPLDESKFRVILYLHYYHDVDRTKLYWSKLLDIPINQFGKIRLKRRAPSRFRQNHKGICFIRYYSVDLQHTVTQTAHCLAETLNTHLAPVA
jgi:hypothetical protein